LLSQAHGMKTRYAAALLLGGLATVLGACATRSSRNPSPVGDTALGVGSNASPGEPAGASDGFRPARPRILVMAPPPGSSVPPPLPPSRPVIVAAPEPNTLYVEAIKAKQVLAHTIYADEIRATRVTARVYRTERLETRGWHGAIDTGVLSASVIYVKELEADTVEADTIFVYKMKVSGQ